jgi:outer membrane autotransporter protein
MPRGWVQGFGVGGNFGGDGNGASLNYSQAGGLVGVDLGQDETGKVGVVGGNSYVNYNDGFGASGQITSYQLGAYLFKHDEISYFLGSANYGFNSYFSNRNVTVAGVNQTLHADTDGSQIGANAETGLKLPLGPFEIQPLVGLQYMYVAQGGFNEVGGPAALNVTRGRASSLRANIGARMIFAQWLGPNGSIWTPYSHARFVTDMLDNGTIVNATFSGAPIGNNFAVQGTRIGQSYGVLGEGLEIRVNEAWSLFGGADILAGERITVVTGSIGSLCRW